ncbi:hypothetical protein Plhal304r1_c004g0016101 [Plasmopara halstedii]
MVMDCQLDVCIVLSCKVSLDNGGVFPCPECILSVKLCRTFSNFKCIDRYPSTWERSVFFCSWFAKCIRFTRVLFLWANKVLAE